MSKVFEMLASALIGSVDYDPKSETTQEIMVKSGMKKTWVLKRIKQELASGRLEKCLKMVNDRPQPAYRIKRK